MKKFDSKGKGFDYIGSYKCNYTYYPDWVYNDGGVINYFDDKPTGFQYDAPVITYSNLNYVRIQQSKDFNC